MSIIINTNTLKCTHEVYQHNGCYYLALRDELMFSVVYEDEGTFHCIPCKGYEWLVLEYAEEGVFSIDASTEREMHRRIKWEAESARLRQAIYHESVYGIDEADSGRYNY